MTFKHKLAHRLALLRGVLGVVAVATTSCEHPTAISDGADPIQVVLPSAGHPHEPGGMTRIWEHGFSCLPGAGCDLAGASTHENLTYASTQRDATAPVSPGGVFRVQWPAGWHDGVGPIVWDAWNTTDMYSSTRMREVYLSFEMKIPTPDFENQSVGTKLFYIEYGNTSQDNEGFLMLDNAYGYGQGEAIKSAWGLTMYLSEADDRTGVGDGKGHYQNVDATKYFTCGVWHQVEMYLKANTVDQSDGIFRMWIDGHLITEVLNQKYLDSRYAFTDGFFMFHMDPVWGGYAGNVKTRDDFMWYDHIYISGIRQ